MFDREGIAIWIPQELFQEPIPRLIPIQMSKTLVFKSNCIFINTVMLLSCKIKHSKSIEP